MHSGLEAPVRPTAMPADVGGGLSPLDRWCRTDSMPERLSIINGLAGRRLSSGAAAEVWMHLMGKVEGSTPADQVALMLRQFLMLAPEHPKAGALFDLLMNGPSATARSPQLEIVFMITSCRRYLSRAQSLRNEMQARGAVATIVVGDPAVATARDEGAVVTLPVADSYEALPTKVLEGLSFLRRRHGPLTCLVKLDDDMAFSPRFDPAALAMAARHRDYVGQPIGPLDCDRCWHQGKTSTPLPVYSRRSEAHFAKGAMYVLGPRAVEHLVREWIFFPGEFAGFLYEDRAIGAMLQRAGIVVAPMSLTEMGVIFEHEERYVAAPGLHPIPGVPR